MAHLLTATLLDSYDWMRVAPPSWKARARDDFLGTVRRTKRFTPTDEQARGMAFERLVCEHVNDTDSSYRTACLAKFQEWDASGDFDRAMNVALKFKELLPDSLQQVKLAKEMSVDGEDYLWFGYADLVYPNKGIADIKTCTRWRGEGKYLNKIQHQVYRYTSGLVPFAYLVADFDGTQLPTELHIVRPPDATEEQIEADLWQRTRELVQFLKVSDLWDDYIRIFSKGK